LTVKNSALSVCGSTPAFATIVGIGFGSVMIAVKMPCVSALTAPKFSTTTVPPVGALLNGICCITQTVMIKASVMSVMPATSIRINDL